MAKTITVDGPELVVSINPHVHTGESIGSTMFDVLLALLPTTVIGLYNFGLRGLLLLLVCIVSAMVAEELCTRVRGLPSTLHDLSAALTGLFLALVCPVNMPLWMAAVGSFFAIVFAKQVYGGVGRNIYNPALVGRCYLLVAYPAALTTWVSIDKLWATGTWSRWSYALTDAVTSATPLGVLKEQYFKSGDWAGAAAYCQGKMAAAFLGFGPQYGIAGCLGETSALALLVGAVYLFRKSHITWHIPVGTLAGMFGTGLLVYGTPFAGPAWSISFFGLLAGGGIIGAFYMATDMVTSPVTRKGRLWFGIGVGVLCVLIRRFGAYPEGMSFAILLMNNVTPLLDQWTLSPVFGQTGKGE